MLAIAVVGLGGCRRAAAEAPVVARPPPIGVNLTGIAPWSSEFPFTDIARVGDGPRTVPGNGEPAALDPAWRQRVQPFGVLRFMDWGATNGSPIATWTDRAGLGDPASWTGPRGIAIERMVDTANALGADPWFCIPHRVDDDYARQFARLVHARLHPSRRIYVEYGNELWNTGFAQTQWALAESKRLGLASPGGQPAVFTARRACALLGIVKATFAERGPGQGERVVRVLSGQAAWDNFLSHGLADGDTPRQVDAIAIAPYFNGGTNDPTQLERSLRKRPEQLIDAMLADIRGPVRDGIAAHARLARRHGLPLIAYEGGPHDTASQMPKAAQQPLLDLQQAAHRHPRMRETVAALLDVWAAAGGGLFVYYADMGNWSIHGLWGALEHMRQDPAAAPKYQALRAAAEAGAAANRR